MVGARSKDPGTLRVTTAQLCTTCDVVVTAVQSEVTSCAIVELPHAGLAAYSATCAYVQSSMDMPHHTQAFFCAAAGLSLPSNVGGGQPKTPLGVQYSGVLSPLTAALMMANDVAYKA